MTQRLFRLAAGKLRDPLVQCSTVATIVCVASRIEQFVLQSGDHSLQQHTVTGNLITQSTQRKEVVTAQQRFVVTRREAFRFCQRPFGQNSRFQQLGRIFGVILAHEAQRQQNRLLPARVVQVAANQLGAAFAAGHQVAGSVILFEGQVHEAITVRRPFHEKTSVDPHLGQEFVNLIKNVVRRVVHIPRLALHPRPCATQLVDHIPFGRQAGGPMGVHPIGQFAQNPIDMALFREGALCHPLRSAPSLRQRCRRDVVQLDTLLGQPRPTLVNQRQNAQQQRVGRHTAHPRRAAHRRHDAIHLKLRRAVLLLFGNIRRLRALHRQRPARQEALDLRLVHVLHRVMGKGRGQRGVAVARDAAGDDEAIARPLVMAHESHDLLNDADAVIGGHDLVQAVQHDKAVTRLQFLRHQILQAARVHLVAVAHFGQLVAQGALPPPFVVGIFRNTHVDGEAGRAEVSIGRILVVQHRLGMLQRQVMEQRRLARARIAQNHQLRMLRHRRRQFHQLSAERFGLALRLAPKKFVLQLLPRFGAQRLVRQLCLQHRQLVGAQLGIDIGAQLALGTERNVDLVQLHLHLALRLDRAARIQVVVLITQPRQVGAARFVGGGGLVRHDAEGLTPRRGNVDGRELRNQPFHQPQRRRLVEVFDQRLPRLHRGKLRPNRGEQRGQFSGVAARPCQGVGQVVQRGGIGLQHRHGQALAQRVVPLAAQPRQRIVGQQGRARGRIGG